MSRVWAFVGCFFVFVFFLCLSCLYLLCTVYLFSVPHINFYNVEYAEDQTQCAPAQWALLMHGDAQPSHTFTLLVASVVVAVFSTLLATTGLYALRQGCWVAGHSLWKAPQLVSVVRQEHRSRRTWWWGIQTLCPMDARLLEVETDRFPLLPGAQLSLDTTLFVFVLVGYLFSSLSFLYSDLCSFFHVDSAKGNTCSAFSYWGVLPSGGMPSSHKLWAQAPRQIRLLRDFCNDLPGWIGRHRYGAFVPVRRGTRRWDYRKSAIFTTVHSGARRTSEPETSLSLSWRKLVASSVLLHTHKNGETSKRT